MNLQLSELWLDCSCIDFLLLQTQWGCRGMRKPVKACGCKEEVVLRGDAAKMSSRWDAVPEDFSSEASFLPRAESFLVLMILAAYSCPVEIFMHLFTIEKAPLQDKNRGCVIKHLLHALNSHGQALPCFSGILWKWVPERLHLVQVNSWWVNTVSY